MDDESLAPFRTLVSGLGLIVLWGLVFVMFLDVFEGGNWFVAAGTIMAAVIGVACLIHLVAPRLTTLAALMGFIAGLGAWGVWFWRSGRITMWIENPQLMFHDVRETVYYGLTPLDPSGPLEDLLLLVALLAVSATALILVGSGMPLAAGVATALFMLAPSVVTGTRITGSFLVVAGLVLALLAWLGSPRARPSGLAAAAIAVALAAGTVVLAPATRDRVWNNAIVPSPVSSTIPDVTITLANDLRHRGTARAFTFESSWTGPVHFALATLREFDDGRWLPHEEMNDDDLTVDTTRVDNQLPPVQFGGDLTDAQTIPYVTVSIDGLISEWLPLPANSLQVIDSGGALDPNDWSWQQDSNTARTETSGTQRGDEYTVRFSPSPENLRGWIFPRESVQLYPDVDAAPASHQPYLGLPSELSGTLADAVADAVPSDVDDRLTVGHLLEAYFTSGEFEYDESAPYSPGVDADDPYAVMAALIEQQRGFCVHYASTFAVMARSLGVPTRVVVGYASHAERGETSVVRGSELHAWPEIFVEGPGWMPFEPTPGGAGARASAGVDAEDLELEPADPEQDPEPTVPDEPVEMPDDDPAVDDAPAPSGAADDGDADGSSLVWFGAALGVLALVLLPALLRGAIRERRRRRIRRGKDPGVNAWREFRDSAIDLGRLADAPLRAQTPEAEIEYLEEAGLLDGDAARAAQRIANAMSAERYGNRTHDQPDLTGSLTIAVGSMRESSAPAVRTRALLLPQSLVPRSLWRR